MSAAAPLSLLMRARRMFDRVAVYLPLLLMGVMAMSTYWLVRNTPAIGEAELEAAPRHVPDYFMRNFSVLPSNIAFKPGIFREVIEPL